ncbi:sulfatase-like hydrolase/transferase [Rosistilla oblonga]|uniref:sulfatase-like hydrolase/transferase n=1 Tax=Rosistilla oblonga TaxID=2527990 RepID=UPI003A988348
MNRLVLLLLCATTACWAAAGSAAERPNILWITSEDHGPEMGCYGDEFATTPNVDALAKKGMRYKLAWSTAPVCAPARTTLITGLYPPSCGGQHMRSMAQLPESIPLYPALLSKAGYYCTNNNKQDYNVRPQGELGWADSSRKAHYKNRDPEQPFFAIFNETCSHESKIRTRPHKQIHDPAKVRVPAYHPDNEDTRRDWAQYYDVVTQADATAGKLLRELDKQGLTDSTIVFYYGDHGSGMARGKRWTYNSGLAVPLVVYFPEKWRHLAPKEYQTGGVSDRLVGFVDLAPTLLSLAGVQPPEWMQGQAIAGKYETEAPKYMYGFRDRMDERYDFIRTVTDGRFQYIRNFNPHFIYGQFVSYNFQTPSTAAWKRAYDAGLCNAAQSHFWNLKPAEELYDLQADPDEVNNLADSPDHQQKLGELRDALYQWCHDIRDVGFLPEGEIHSRSEGSTPYEMARDETKYPFEKIFAAADLATHRNPEDLDQLKSLLTDSDSAVRYWGAVGILNRGGDAVNASKQALLAALGDDSPYVRVAAGYALGKFGDKEMQRQGIECLIDVAPSKPGTNVFAAIAALNAIDKLDEKVAFAKAEIDKMPVGEIVSPDKRYGGYPQRLLTKIQDDFKANASSR